MTANLTPLARSLSPLLGRLRPQLDCLTASPQLNLSFAVAVQTWQPLPPSSDTRHSISILSSTASPSQHRSWPIHHQRHILALIRFIRIGFHFHSHSDCALPLISHARAFAASPFSFAPLASLGPHTTTNTSYSAFRSFHHLHLMNLLSIQLAYLSLSLRAEEYI